jgi:hypothetical protein
LYEINTVRVDYQKFSGLTLLERCHKNGDGFLNHIVTSDETWVSFVNIEPKEQSNQWMHAQSPDKPTNLNNRCLPATKLMATVFWGRKRVLMVEFMQRCTSITSEVYEYCETLQRLRTAIRNKRRVMLTYGKVHHHDNALPHTAAFTFQLGVV